MAVVAALNRSMMPFSLEFTKLVTHFTSDTENTSVATTTSFSSSEQTSGSSVLGQGKRLHDYFVHNIFYYFILAICSVGTINNIIVMLTMLMSVKLIKNSGGILIMALAFVDCSLNVSVWIDWYDYFHHVIKNFAYCVAFTYYWHITRSLTHLITMLISINRYALVCHPFTHRKITSRKSTMFQLIAAITFASVGSIYVLYTNDPDAEFCTLDRKAIHIYFIAFNIVDSVLSNIVPLGVTIILTTKILFALKKNKQTLHDGQERPATSQSKSWMGKKNDQTLDDGQERPKTSQNSYNKSRIDKKSKHSFDDGPEISASSRGSISESKESGSTPRNKREVRRLTKGSEAEKNLTKALVAVNLAFILLLLPFIIMHTIYFLYYLLNADRSDTYYYITFAWVIFYLFETLNYSINLFLYSWYSPMFRLSLIKLLPCGCSRISSK